jgi:hypothetical protein
MQLTALPGIQPLLVVLDHSLAQMLIHKHASERKHTSKYILNLARYQSSYFLNKFVELPQTGFG